MPFQTGFTYDIFRLVSHMPFQIGFTYVNLYWFQKIMPFQTGFTYICHFRLVSHMPLPIFSHMPFQTGFSYAISDWLRSSCCWPTWQWLTGSTESSLTRRYYDDILHPPTRCLISWYGGWKMFTLFVVND